MRLSSLVNVKDEMLSFCESGEVENVRGCGDFAWKVIKKYTEHNETNAQLWWFTTEWVGIRKGCGLTPHNPKIHVRGRNDMGFRTGPTLFFLTLLKVAKVLYGCHLTTAVFV